jgi:predicted dithiol-disulfide oxidoreductase (DUF899 family)
MSTRTVDNPKIISREEWLVARKKLLAREKQLTRERDAVAAERRQLPWVKVEGKVEYNYELTQFPGAEAPGISVFDKDKDGNVFHTYSAYGRGTETTNTYNYLDYVPKGRD